MTAGVRRVVIATDSYPPLIGGATRQARLIAHALRDRRYEVCVVTPVQDGAPTREDDDGVDVRRLNALTFRIPGLAERAHRLTPPPYPDPELVWRIRRALCDFRPDLVHTYGWISYSVALAMLGTRIPLLLSLRDYGNVCALRTLVHDGGVCSGPGYAKCAGCASRSYGPVKGVVSAASVLLARRPLSRRIDGLHSVSNYVYDVAERHLLGSRSRRALTALPKAILPDFGEELPDEIPDPAALAQLPKSPFILYVGALRKIKGLEVLLDAHGRLSNPPPLVLIGGRAPDTPDFPSDVTVLEGVSQPTVMRAWDRALFGVAPSILAEPLGNAVHEAMSRGRAVIGTTPGGHADMITDGRNGLLVPGGDPAALEMAMRRLIDDVPFRASLAAAAAGDTGQRFLRDTVLPRLEELYRETALARSEAEVAR